MMMINKNSKRSYADMRIMTTLKSAGYFGPACGPFTQPLTSSICCIECQNSKVQKKHYFSELQTQYFDRKLTKLPLGVLNGLDERVFSEEDANQMEQIKYNCEICRKQFHNKDHYLNHLVSRKHKRKMERNGRTSFERSPARHYALADMKNEKIVEMNSDVKPLDSNQWLKDLKNPVEHNNCLFCNHHSRSVTNNLKHMKEKHSFLVPDVDYCINQKGLLIYLGQKVYGEHKCIWCSGKRFRNAEAARMHMIDKGHCKMLYEIETQHEYMQFYDYVPKHLNAKNDDLDANLPETPLVLSDEDEDEEDIEFRKLMQEEPRVPDLSDYIATLNDILITCILHRNDKQSRVVQAKVERTCSEEWTADEA